MAKSKLIEHPPLVVATAPARHTPEIEFSGQRRLVRPSLSMRAVAGRQTALYGHGPALTSRTVPTNGSREESSHAEVFYFQKQIQAQTRMVVVLENGEQLEGVVEWYDRYAIKLRNVGPMNGRNRVLVYKDSVRYIYKAGENSPRTMS
ncbi:MAG: RNA chaperone Hfq [Acidobacteriaceae bacterium]